MVAAMVTVQGGSSCFRTYLILNILFNKTNIYEWIFQFIHFRWIRDVEKPLELVSY
jgi:hypothetical protein